MSNLRHRPSLVRSYSITHPPGRVGLPNQPGWDVIVFSNTGLFTALTDTEAWTIPAHRALCVPSGTRLRIDATRRVSMRCLYLDATLGHVGDVLRVVNLTPLARELMLSAIAAAPADLTRAEDVATITLLAHELGRETGAPLQLPLPVDPVSRRLADAIMSDPSLPLDDLLRAAGSSRRTIERRFAAQSGMGLGHWRRRARVLKAVALLAEGATVTHVSAAVGYSTPSAFVAAFRAELGTSPLRFVHR